MTIQSGEFPVVVQAYQPSGTSDLFVAEQLVHNQSETDVFTSRYAGMLIKARKPNESEFQFQTASPHYTPVRSRSRGVGAGFVVLLLVVALIVVGFTTGWIQRNIGITL